MVTLGRLRPSDPMTEGMVHKTGREAQGKTNLGFIPESSFSDALLQAGRSNTSLI